jgi:hypothetical protein
LIFGSDRSVLVSLGLAFGFVTLGSPKKSHMKKPNKKPPSAQMGILSRAKVHGNWTSLLVTAGSKLVTSHISTPQAAPAHIHFFAEAALGIGGGPSVNRYSGGKGFLRK